jgi:hypothetical protein
MIGNTPTMIHNVLPMPLSPIVSLLGMAIRIQPG